MDNKILFPTNPKIVFLILIVLIFAGTSTSQVIPNLFAYCSKQESNRWGSKHRIWEGEYVVSVNYSKNPKVSGVNDMDDVIITKAFQNNIPMDLEIPVNIFKAALVDDDNNKWFLTEAGIVSFNGNKWTLHNKNSKVESLEIKGIAFEKNSYGQEIWLATPKGANVASLPIDAISGATTYNDTNSAILSNNVIRVTVGKSPLRWFGTDKGVSAFKSNKWLTPDYEEFYPEFIFQEFPVLSMASGLNGDTLYVGTNGAGIARVFSNDVDGISGASVFAQWGPMILPSDKIYSILIAPDGAKWFGTDMGVARHIGQNSLDNWTAFTIEDGLVNNFVQAITADNEGNIWFGTKGGISVFNSTDWISYTENDGLNSNNVLCIVVDNNGIVWIGTDNGVSSFENGTFTNYK